MKIVWKSRLLTKDVSKDVRSLQARLNMALSWIERT